MRTEVLLKSFAVAVWRRFDGRDLPVITEGVEAASAFEALEMVLWEQGWQAAAHAHVVACDGSIQYRADGVRLAPQAVRQRQVEEAVHWQVMQSWQTAQAVAVFGEKR